MIVAALNAQFQQLLDDISQRVDDAETAATNAAASEAAAAASEANAATSETNAAASASAAASSETNAAASAAAAGTSESNASTSASNAATSETNAANSAILAGQSASEALSAANNATSAATNAQAFSQTAQAEADRARSEADRAEAVNREVQNDIRVITASGTAPGNVPVQDLLKIASANGHFIIQPEGGNDPDGPATIVNLPDEPRAGNGTVWFFSTQLSLGGNPNDPRILDFTTESGASEIQGDASPLFHQGSSGVPARSAKSLKRCEFLDGKWMLATVGTDHTILMDFTPGVTNTGRVWSLFPHRGFVNVRDDGAGNNIDLPDLPREIWAQGIQWRFARLTEDGTGGNNAFAAAGSADVKGVISMNAAASFGGRKATWAPFVGADGTWFISTF